MTVFHEWARAHGVSAAAIADYERRLHIVHDVEHDGSLSEAGVSSRQRLEAASIPGLYLWRNNVGAYTDPEKGHVRYGLCNDSKKLNTVIKSADHIGCFKRLIVQEDVGKFIGQFISREEKREGWKWKGDAHEVAQARWAELINSLGGDACFSAGPGSFDRLTKPLYTYNSVK